MGLDSVELHYEVEENFGIYIPNLKAEQICTVGELYETIVELIYTDEWSYIHNTQKCKSQHLFYVLRREIQNLNLPTKAIVSPQMAITEFMTPTTIRSDWEKLENRIGIQFPALEHTPRSKKQIKALNKLCFFGSVICSILALQSAVFGLFVIVFFAVFVGVDFHLQAYKRESPVANIRELVNILLKAIEPRFEYLEHDKAFIYRKLQSLIVEKLGVDVSEVTYNAHFVNDLRID